VGIAHPARIENEPMIQALQQQPITFDEFVEWIPEASECRYELHRGAIVEMPKPRGKYSDVAGFTNGKVFIQIEQMQLPYMMPKECIVRSVRRLIENRPTVHRAMNRMSLSSIAQRW
jgi:Uma2 family endonuclease